MARPSLVFLLVLILAPALAAQEPAVKPGAPAAEALRGRGGIGDPATVSLVLTAVLAIVGVGIVLGTRRKPTGSAGVLRVVGRAHLTGRHAVYLLRAGDRTLIVGVGPQGAPSLLGELDPSPSTPNSHHPGDALQDDCK
ncbi:flagellar biosynthetic protein FliO [Tautonia rosea]|uniref:flagellar biosynthetic protein FliO n=1 Tax=Tautonia rosea TaxID=2728037 RepID=UPI001F2B02D0|nr:flagellar biosynthetic protein FliO [Tautonia rosea]